MPQVPFQVDTRLISGNGVIQVPSSVKTARKLWLYADLIRPPSKDFISFKWLYPRSEYAKIQRMQGAYVCEEFNFEFKQQRWEFIVDSAAQSQYETQCSFLALTTSIKNIANAAGIFTATSPYSKVQPLEVDFDRFVVTCRDDSFISLRLWALLPDLCPDQEQGSVPPPAAPTPPPPIPAGTPANGFDSAYTPSNPYASQFSSAETQPLAIDKPYVSGNLSQCTRVSVTVQYTFTVSGGQPVPGSQQYFAYAPVKRIYVDEISPGGSSLFSEDFGNGNSNCSAAAQNRRVNRSVGLFNVISVSIVAAPR